MGTVSESNVWVREWRDGSAYNYTDWQTVNSKNGSLICGTSSGYNYVICIKFTLTESVSKLYFNFSTHNTMPNYLATFNYKITSSENSSLTNANSSTSGDGSFKWTTTNQYTAVTMPVEKRLGAGTYYCYMWASLSAANYPHNWASMRWYPSTHTYGGFSLTYDKSNSCIYIDNGSSFDAYEIYIDNGTSWDLYQAYIDNGSSWDECG